ncbi:Regulator of chromosome condensation, RCC1 [uncultured Caudovirales phage]|uniref:Regulator of chromosome condensation, RCC1 n=1 Tax=uncultured Caudovirales phage TaxID=2100421 RepID=A0A6J5QW14_9CAUD|nr:Regulator of chromosome condensation, RCC1 [uncultured Caudovirales phage]CAB4165542.1 Regulator of chromosome condensation, RCC1 [uncultured Caudovirales phage]CAB4186806.1 Regulator of chromosome condensation, RCC1 [uncultured Caudovirales phage]CAB4221590.1 Regulator of chromosome condensation, RCC1 [uncultured Caudovirales phage]
MTITFGPGVSLGPGIQVVMPDPMLIWAFGSGDNGSLGLNKVVSYSSPVQVGSLATWTSKISSGKKWVMAIKSDASLWTWGYNANGQLGLGDTANRSSPIQVGSLTTWSQISGNTVSTLAVKTDGTLWAWGGGYGGGLGLGNTNNYSSPKQVGILTTWLSATAGPYSGNAIKTDGTLWAWGDNTSGQLGTGDRIHRSSPVQVGLLTNWLSIAASNYGPQENFRLAVKTDGTLWGWGSGKYGSLGLGNQTYYSSPKQIGSLTNWATASAAVRYSIALKTDGTMWSWGDGFSYGQLGLNRPQETLLSPVQIGALTNWATQQASDYVGRATKTNGTLWVWGSNYGGALGNNQDSFTGDTKHMSSPIQVGSSTGWLAVTGGYRYTIARGT